MNTKVIQNIGNVLAKNSPTILTGLGVAGVITTAIMAVKATPKALLIVDQEEHLRTLHDNDPEPLTPVEILKLTWKCYIPAMIMGGVTIGCIIGANSVNLKRNAALASLYSISETALKEYKEKVVETIGENKHRQIEDEIAHDRITRNPPIDEEIIFTGKGDTLCYDSLSGRYFKSDPEKIRGAFNTLNYNMRNEMFVTLNQFYSDLGLQETTLGDLMGWHIDQGIVEPRLSSQLNNNDKPCLVINYTIEPRYSSIE
jgi:hypothetical protein